MRRLVLAGAVLALLLVGAVAATAHQNKQTGGPNGDVLDGHDHHDSQEGKGGCDELLGRGDGDYGLGGEQGCDRLRGMEGGDALVVCDDNAGNDAAYGGGGANDLCLVSLADHADLATCEDVWLEPYNC